MSPAAQIPVLIDRLTVRVGRKSGVYLEVDIRGSKVYMPPDAKQRTLHSGRAAARASLVEKHLAQT